MTSIEILNLYILLVGPWWLSASLFLPQRKNLSTVQYNIYNKDYDPTILI